MSKRRHKILTIAGFDPSGGAGVLADIKTFESHKCQGFAVCTANTIQNESEFIASNWVDLELVLNQLKVLMSEHRFRYIKVGLIPSIEFLGKLIDYLNKNNSEIRIIWDPILSTSSGFDFDMNLTGVDSILKKVYMVTPNWHEVLLLGKKEDQKKSALELAKYTHVCLKGGHNEAARGRDYLYYKNKVYPLNPKGRRMCEKHGSGCVFSSALASNLLLGYPMLKACLRSKSYISKFLSSSEYKLGYHKV